MADRILNLNQQIALLPAAIPDSVLDFLEDFHFPSSLTVEATRNAFDADYLKTQGDKLVAALDALKAEMGKLVQLGVEQAGRDIPGGFLLKLTFEKGVRGLGIVTKLKERTILRLEVAAGEYDETHLKELLRSPPK